jgi:hypothetical protein
MAPRKLCAGVVVVAVVVVVVHRLVFGYQVCTSKGSKWGGEEWIKRTTHIPTLALPYILAAGTLVTSDGADSAETTALLPSATMPDVVVSIEDEGKTFDTAVDVTDLVAQIKVQLTLSFRTVFSHHNPRYSALSAFALHV